MELGTMSQVHAVDWTLRMLRLLRPHDLDGARKIRLGRPYDGGYVMIDRFEQATAAYSLGINDDVSWDLEIAALDIPVFQYDPTIEALPENHPLFHWEPRYVSGYVDEAENVASLESLVHRNGHTDHTNMILKCDIEGSEWLLLRNTPQSILGKFSQIVLELHHLSMMDDLVHAENIESTLTNLTRSHTVVHIHANNFSPWTTAWGVPIPLTLELTLIRNDEGPLSPSQEIFPTRMDMPCDKTAPDLHLGRFSYE